MPRRDNMRKAKEIIAQYRASSIATQEQHKKEAETRIPPLREVNDQLSMTGLKIVGEAMSHSLSEEKLAQIRREYEDLAARKRNLLLAFGYPEDYVDIKYHCPLCSDTGYVGIDMCKCLKRELVLASLESSGLASLTKNQNFHTFSLDYYENNDKIRMTYNLNTMKDFAANFTPGCGINWLFIGATGLGKTHLSTSVAVELIKKGYDVVYESAQQIMTDYETVRFSSNTVPDYDFPDLTRYTEADLLIMDDLGTEMTTQYTLSCLYNIINTRINRNLSTIISTNLTQKELRERYTDRITSRLLGEYKPLIFSGKDIRAQKLMKQG